MIFSNILPIGKTIEWDYTEDFGRVQATARGIIQGHEVKDYFITEDDGELSLIVDTYYKVHTDTDLMYCLVNNENIRVIEG